VSANVSCSPFAGRAMRTFRGRGSPGRGRLRRVRRSLTSAGSAPQMCWRTFTLVGAILCPGAKKATPGRRNVSENRGLRVSGSESTPRRKRTSPEANVGGPRTSVWANVAGRGGQGGGGTCRSPCRRVCNRRVACRQAPRSARGSPRAPRPPRPEAPGSIRAPRPSRARRVGRAGRARRVGHADRARRARRADRRRRARRTRRAERARPECTRAGGAGRSPRPARFRSVTQPSRAVAGT
jgi:hypothetical protein